MLTIETDDGFPPSDTKPDPTTASTTNADGWPAPSSTDSAPTGSSDNLQALSPDDLPAFVPATSYSRAALPPSLRGEEDEDEPLLLVEALQLSYGAKRGPSFLDILTGARKSGLGGEGEGGETGAIGKGSSGSSVISRGGSLTASLGASQDPAKALPSSTSTATRPSTNSPPPAPFTASVPIESSKIGRVIGTGGKNIISIKAKTSCEVVIDRGSSSVVISGPSNAQVVAAQKLVEVARDEGTMALSALLEKGLDLGEASEPPGAAEPGSSAPPRSSSPLPSIKGPAKGAPPPPSTPTITINTPPPPPPARDSILNLEVRLVIVRPQESSSFTQHRIRLSQMNTLKDVKEILGERVGLSLGVMDKVVVRGRVWHGEESQRMLRDVGIKDEKVPIIVIHEEKAAMLDLMVKTPRGSKHPLLDLRPSMTVLDLKRRLALMPRLQGLVSDATPVSVEGLKGRPGDHVTLREVGIDQEGWRVWLTVTGSRRGRAGGVDILIFGPNNELAK